MVFHQLWPNTQKALGPTTSGGFIEVNNCLIWCSTAHKPFGSTFVPPLESCALMLFRIIVTLYVELFWCMIPCVHKFWFEFLPKIKLLQSADDWNFYFKITEPFIKNTCWSNLKNSSNFTNHITLELFALIFCCCPQCTLRGLVTSKQFLLQFTNT